MENYIIAEIAKQYAINCHKETNHLYDGQPYVVHLEIVNDVIEEFIDLIPSNYRNTVRAGGWVHDTIEDCRQTKNDVKKATNEEVAELAYALTNEKGRNRKERANNKYYRGIRRTKYAKFLKLADRIANVVYSHRKIGSNKGETMFFKYKKENHNFIWQLIKPEWYEFHQWFVKFLIGKKNYMVYRKDKDEYSKLITYLENLFGKKNYIVYRKDKDE